MSHPVLTVENVTKRFATVLAVDDFSFAVGHGEILALLGPNGAGKTTLVRMLMGIIEPDSGAITYALDGSPAVPPRAELGFLPEERGLYQDVPILRLLSYFASLRGMKRVNAERAALGWLQRLDLADRARENVKSLSKGNQQKVQFISAVIHGPRFLVLDEPFSGLDPLNQELFLDLVRELRDGGATVVLSAHQMDLVERLADRIVLMGSGKRLEIGSVDELRQRWGVGDELVVHYAAGDPDSLAGSPWVREVAVVGDGVVRLRLERGAPLGDVLTAAVTKLDVTRVHTGEARLHEIYVGIMGRGSVVAASPDTGARGAL
jgi:ABC-2 type transport system ATP-binding protein